MTMLSKGRILETLILAILGKRYSWDPILACWLKGTPDELKIGYGEDVVHVEGNWYACIMDR